MRVDWDLSKEHTREQVTWPRDQREGSSAEVAPLESVRIELPAGQVLKTSDRLKRIILERGGGGVSAVPGPEGEVITHVRVDSESLSVEDAYARVLAYAEQFDLPRAPLDAWRKRRERGLDPVTDRTSTTVNGRGLGANDGPVPYLELRYSGVAWVVSMQFSWLEPRPPGIS